MFSGKQIAVGLCAEVNSHFRSNAEARRPKHHAVPPPLPFATDPLSNLSRSFSPRLLSILSAACLILQSQNDHGEARTASHRPPPASHCQ